MPQVKINTIIFKYPRLLLYSQLPDSINSIT